MEPSSKRCRIMTEEVSIPGRIVEINLVRRPRIKAAWSIMENNYYGQGEDSDSGWDEDNGDIYYAKLWAIKSDCPVPAIAKDTYPLVFKWYADDVHKETPGACSSPQTHFDFQKDILYITPSTFYEKYTDMQNAGIKFASMEVGLDQTPMISGVLNMAKDEDFKKVENLALLVDAENPEYSRNEYALLNIENWLASMLRNTFCSLKTLTIVLDHYDALPRNFPTIGFVDLKTSKSTRDFVFKDDLIDMDKAYRIYRPGGKMGVLDVNWREPPKHPNIKELKINETLLAARREKEIKAGKGKWNLPPIEYKIVMTRTVESELRQAAREYRDQVLTNLCERD